ncbi:hypothetical protein K439DRAFT_313084 [Ramaria rubella]|nr:hypothetical protein K439DRAFT_313084 [Ramaria rubella]
MIYNLRFRWSPDPFVYPIHLIGGQTGGEEFTACQWVQGSSALVVKGLDVWFHSQYLRGIQVTYSNNSRSLVFGSDDNSHSSIVFTPGELVTSLTLWGNGIGTRAGRIRLTTNRDQTLEVGKDTSGQTAYDIDTGAGLLVGMCGRSGVDIDQLGAIFLKYKVIHVSIRDIKYDPDLSNTAEGICIFEVALNKAHFTNPASAKGPKTWTFGGSASRTTSTTYNQTTGNTFQPSAAVEVSAKPFGIGGKVTSTGFQWPHQNSVTTGTSVSNLLTFTWGLTGELQPGEEIVCLAAVQRGEGRTNYDATVIVELENGATNEFKERGVFQNVAFTEVSVTTKNIENENVKPALELMTVSKPIEN